MDDNTGGASSARSLNSLTWAVVAERPNGRQLVYSTHIKREDADRVRAQLERIGCKARVEVAWPADTAGRERPGLRA